ncbi:MULTISPECIES: hypothetical protein [unclassified Streptomyces]|uniref:hypothetical protein n=1 Tax=unclassified Streptomyces TaxID=2593676 RepID=UPI00362C2B53
MADAQITLAYSRLAGIVAMPTGTQYQTAMRVLTGSGFRRSPDDGVCHLPGGDQETVKATVAAMVRQAEAAGVGVRTSSRGYIGDTARAIAELLPGSWTAQVEVYCHPAWQMDLLPYLWDTGELAQAVRTDRAVPHAAILTHRDSDTTLLLVERAGHRRGYLVGALAPTTFNEVLDDPHAPSGIALPAAPERAARAIVQQYLPGYDRAALTRRTAYVEEALGLITSQRASWEALRAGLWRPDASPLDLVELGQATVALLAGAWREFLTVLDHAPELLDQCRPAASAWPEDATALGLLADALVEAQQVRQAGADRAEHHARVWPAIETWRVHTTPFLRQARAASPRPRSSRIAGHPAPRPLPPGAAGHHR